jgi:capsular polysaccharide transport system permease protein
MSNFLKESRTWQAAIVLMLMFTLYWGFFAADRYVSESHVVVENLQGPRDMQLDLAGLLGGGGGGGNRTQLLLRDYLLSADMLTKLDEKLKLRVHYADSPDIFSRARAWDLPQERFLGYYRSRVRVDFDDYAGLLVIRAQAYSPEMAQAIGRELVEDGERFMNETAHKLAREQVSFAEKEVAQAGKRVLEARQALLAYQNQHGLVSPRATVETVSGVVARLESELAALRTRQRAMRAYLAPNAPDLVQVGTQIHAIEEQLDIERSRTASAKGRPLNRIVEQYERMLVEAEFTQDLYRTALTALERSRIEATRTLKKVSVVQAPTLPERALEPRRLYNIAIYVLATLLLTGIVQLLAAIVREHRD